MVSANIYLLCRKRYLEKFSFVHFPEEKRKYWNLIDVNQTFCVVSFDINLIFEMTESWNIKVQNLKLSLQNFTVPKLQELNVKVNRLQSNLSVAPFANTEISNWFHKTSIFWSDEWWDMKVFQICVTNWNNPSNWFHANQTISRHFSRLTLLVYRRSLVINLTIYNLQTLYDYRLQNSTKTQDNNSRHIYVCRIYDEINYCLESCLFIYFDAHDIYNDNWHWSTVLSSVQPLFFCKPTARPNFKTTNNPIRRLQLIASSIV